MACVSGMLNQYREDAADVLKVAEDDPNEEVVKIVKSGQAFLALWIGFRAGLGLSDFCCE